MVGNSDAEDSKDTLFNFLERHNTANIVNDKTLDNPRCTDLFIKANFDVFKIQKGLSHFYKIVVTVLKESFSKAPLKEMFHRDYKNFELDKFKHKLRNIIQNESVECYYQFEKVFVDIINKWVLSFKKKFQRAIYAPFVTKRLRKALI